jgi:DNA-binding transcriptional ArsR family regulator
VWKTAGVHLVPTERAHRRVIDGERVCDAITALDDQAELAASADLFALLADPNRLMLLVCIQRAGPISVSDLAVAVDMNDTTVSQALRLLRANGLVSAQRDGRVIRYELGDDAFLAELLQQAAHRRRLGQQLTT